MPLKTLKAVRTRAAGPEAGDPLSRFTLRFDRRLHDEIVRRAELAQVSVNAYAASIFASHLALPPEVPFALADLVSVGSLSAPDADLLVTALRDRKRLAVVGTSGSGRTRLLEILASHRSGAYRRVVLTDSSRSLLAAASVEELHTCSELSFPAIVDELLRRPQDMVFLDAARRPDTVSAVIRLCRTSEHGYHIGGSAVLDMRAASAPDVVREIVRVSGATEVDVLRSLDFIVFADRTPQGIRYLVSDLSQPASFAGSAVAV